MFLKSWKIPVCFSKVKYRNSSFIAAKAKGLLGFTGLQAVEPFNSELVSHIDALNVSH